MTLCISTVKRSHLGLLLSLLLALSGCASGVLAVATPLSLGASTLESDTADVSLFKANTGRGSVVV
ncbi:MAG TPA: hypothetical protein VMF89_09945, partial [Polyangiales bacterium]|nr:hypothetical protein [Polyangiales bacterium]